MAEESAKSTKKSAPAETPSAADLEFTTAPAGPTIQKQANAERPWEDAAEVSGRPTTTITVTDGEGNAQEVELTPSDAAQAQERAISAAQTDDTYGAGPSNPALKEPTDEEKEANEKEYASRVS